jgi:hypothetical protein
MEMVAEDSAAEVHICQEARVVAGAKVKVGRAMEGAED